MISILTHLNHSQLSPRGNSAVESGEHYRQDSPEDVNSNVNVSNYRFSHFYSIRVRMNERESKLSLEYLLSVPMNSDWDSRALSPLKILSFQFSLCRAFRENTSERLSCNNVHDLSQLKCAVKRSKINSIQPTIVM